MRKNKAYGGGRAVYIVDGTRTPFLKFRGNSGQFSAAELAVQCCRTLLLRQHFSPAEIEEVVTGCVIPGADEANISRIVALRIGCDKSVPAWTVQRNCASGLQAIDNAAHDISTGRYDLVLAGGVESMSHAPVLLSASLVNWLASWRQTKGVGARLELLYKFRPHYLTMVSALLKGLTDPVIGLSMGQTAEKLAYRFNITRQAMDTFAMQSHQRLAHAQAQNLLTEVQPIFDFNGKAYLADDGLRSDTTVAGLAKLKPYFDKKYGNITAGNSSQVTDGAAFLLLASAAAVKKYKLPTLARIVDVEWSGVDPSEMGLGPVQATVPLLLRNELSIKDIDYWEINEAFAAQVLACLSALDDPEYCKEHFGLKTQFGSIDQDRVNIYGGAISIGHPIGASGARLVLQLANILQNKNAERGVATLCIGGGQGGAMLIERNTKVTTEAD